MAKKTEPERIIMGIDPGTNVMGYGVIKVVGKKLELIVLGVVELKKYTNHYLKLKRIYERIVQLIEEYLPDEVSIESPFFGKNVQSMLKLGRAQGVAMAAALSRDVPICEYAPRKVKQMITGMGEASKEQVAAILQNTFNIKELPKDLDATDGLAVAFCHYYATTSVMAKISPEKNTRKVQKNNASWSNFVAKNPEKIHRQ
jgi:crossover junction endodeoxyribonuclease RuvC